MRKRIFLVTMFLIGLHLACSDSSDPAPPNLQIIYNSIQSGDSLNPGAGFFVRFSAPIDLNSLNAQEIYTSYEIFYQDSTGLNSEIIDVQVYKIVSARNITLNDQPLTVWYNSATNEIALIQETTIQMPFGTGEGLAIGQDSTEVVFKAGIANRSGGMLGTDFRIYLHRASSSYQLRAVPNPAYPGFTSQGLQYPRVNFNELPGSCVINIYDNLSNLVQSISHSGGGVENWNLQDLNGFYITPGIYQFEIIESLNFVRGGMFIFPGME